MAYNNFLLSSSTIHILLIIYSLLLPIAFSIVQYDTPLSLICTGKRGYLDPDHIQSRLYVVDELIFKAPTHNGFYDTTRSEGKVNAYGLALCRGNIATNDCKDCLVNATMKATLSCTRTRGAIVWFDLCLLKYSNVDFRRKIDTVDQYIIGGDQERNRNIPSAVRSFLRQLLQTALATSYLFAKGNQNTLYGMVQCTRDLSAFDCRTCLEAAVAKLPYNKEGAGVLFGSCMVRYGNSPFLT